MSEIVEAIKKSCNSRLRVSNEICNGIQSSMNRIRDDMKHGNRGVENELRLIESYVQVLKKLATCSNDIEQSVLNIFDEASQNAKRSSNALTNDLMNDIGRSELVEMRLPRK
jgi:methyl-accepting chemotaxis protein